MTIKNLGFILKYRRTKLLRISQTCLVNEIGVTQAIISRVERGDGISTQLLFKILEFFKEREIITHNILENLFLNHY